MCKVWALYHEAGLDSGPGVYSVRGMTMAVRDETPA
jgi:hypothetical protein